MYARFACRSYGNVLISLAALGEGISSPQTDSMPGAIAASSSSATYQVYRINDELPEVEWIVQGTDGTLYLVPAEPGGWMQRSEYTGQIAKLHTLSQEDARSVCWTVYGDVGRVTMEGANLEPR